MDWKFVLVSRNVASHFLYVIWGFCSVLLHFCDLIKARASVSSMITSLNLLFYSVFLVKLGYRIVNVGFGTLLSYGVFIFLFGRRLKKERPNLFLYLILR